MLQQRIVQILNREYGQPQGGNAYHRWVIHTDKRISSLHVVVSAPIYPDRAHVLIFDPARINGDAVIDVQILNSSDIVALMARIKRISMAIPPSGPLSN